MKGYSLVYLLVAALLPVSAHAGYTAPACKLSDTQMPKVTEDTGQKVLASLWDDRVTWDKFISCVQSGRSAWVDAGLAIRRFSDAGASEELDLALGEALGSSPDHILAKAALPDSGIELDWLCSGPDVDDPRFDSYALSMAEIERRLKALSQVKNQDLEPQVDACRADLEKSKQGVASFYRDNPPPK